MGLKLVKNGRFGVGAAAQHTDLAGKTKGRL
jgi:hypothetical protein